jgi:hypothetical protein
MRTSGVDIRVNISSQYALAQLYEFDKLKGDEVKKELRPNIDRNLSGNALNSEPIILEGERK